MTESPKWTAPAATHGAIARSAASTLRSRLDAVLHYLRQAAQHAEEDPEYVHQLRIATRRAGVALQVFAELIPDELASRLKQSFKAIRKSADDARDLDVMAERLAESPANDSAAQLLEAVLAARVVAQESVKDSDRVYVEGRQLADLADEVSSAVCDPALNQDENPHGRPGTFAERRLRKIVKPFFKNMKVRKNDLAGLHQLRIQGKRLRYALELLAASLPEKPCRKFYRRVVKLQNKLGKITDHSAAAVRWGRWIERVEAPDQIALLEDAVRGEEQLLKVASQKYFRWWTKKRRRMIRKKFESLVEACTAE